MNLIDKLNNFDSIIQKIRFVAGEKTTIPRLWSNMRRLS